MIPHQGPRRAPLAIILLGLLAAPEALGQEPFPTSPPPDPEDRLAVELDLRSEPRPVAYSWNGGVELPFLARGPAARIDFGEAGAAAPALVHLSLNEGAGDVALALGEGASVELVRPAGWTRGRFGSALLLDAESAVWVRGLAAPSGPWTIELRVLPEAPVETGGAGAAEVGIVRAGGLSITLGARGFAARMEGTQVRVNRVPGASAAGYRHVAAVVDRVLGQLVLFVDGEARAAKLPGTGGGPTLDLTVGGEGFRGAVDDLCLHGRALDTAELSERARPAAGLHELSLRYEDGSERTLRPWAGIVEEHVLEGTTLAGGELEHAAASGEGVRWTAAGWRRFDAFPRPQARTTHATAAIGGGRILVFGGELHDSSAGTFANTSETWILDAGRGAWRLSSSPDLPPPSCHQPIAFSPDHGLVLQCGGWRNDARGPAVYDSTWLYRVDEDRWSEASPGGDPFPTKRDCTVAYHAGERVFVVFLTGTYRVMTYDPEADSWRLLGEPRRVWESSAKPAAIKVNGSLAGYDPVSREIVLFGGSFRRGGASLFHDGTVHYDLERNAFTALEPRPSPSPRVRAGFGYDARRRRFVLFGGVRGQDSVRDRDLWTYDPAGRAWRSWDAGAAPSARGGYYGMPYAADLDRFVLALGRHSRRSFLSEAWSLRLDETASGSATYGFDRAAFPGRTLLRVACETPGDSAVELRLRASPDNREWSAWSDAGTELAPESRFLLVRVELHPGAAGEAPAIRSLGFFENGMAPAPAADERVLSVELAPLHR